MWKRSFDIAASLVGLVVLCPVLLIISLAIYLCDGFPVLFRQRRAGWRGEHFTLYKFRTMRIAAHTESGSFDAGDVSRATRLGRVLRSTKADELPQLWNVLRGDMSVVGPRPEVAKWVAVYPQRWEAVLQVRPGITDPASIEYRDEEKLLAAARDPEAAYRDEILPRKLSLYEQYVRQRTFWGDIGIILRTVMSVIRLR